MPRRRLLALGAGASLGIAFTSNSEAQAPSLKAPASGTAPRKRATARGLNESLVDAAKRCGRVGDIVETLHPVDEGLARTSLADCMRAVQAMLPVCSTMGQLAGQDRSGSRTWRRPAPMSVRTARMSAASTNFHHRECKNCAEACAAMIKDVRRSSEPTLGRRRLRHLWWSVARRPICGVFISGQRQAMLVRRLIGVLAVSGVPAACRRARAPQRRHGRSAVPA